MYNLDRLIVHNLPDDVGGSPASLNTVMTTPKSASQLEPPFLVPPLKRAAIGCEAPGPPGHKVIIHASSTSGKHVHDGIEKAIVRTIMVGKGLTWVGLVP